MRFLLYSHDGLGLGHTRRNLAIANAVVQMLPSASVLLATGINETNQFQIAEGIGVLKLPSLRKTPNGSYVSRNMRVPASEIRALRASLMMATVKNFKPDVMLVDKHPFGASGELRQAMQYVVHQGGRLALGLRDILDDRQAVLREWGPNGMLKRIGAIYDLVLVFGQAAVYDTTHEYDFPEALTARTRFCGYVVNEDILEFPSTLHWLNPILEERTRPLVLATTGGGEDGFFLLETFIRAAAHAPWQGMVVTGPMTSAQEIQTLQRLAADANVIFQTFMPGLSSLYWSADALVCMGGYNTLVEAASKGLPVVCVPRVTPRSEQRLRAEAFERLGLLKTIPPAELNVHILREEVARAMQETRQRLLDRAHNVLGFDGARQAASQLVALASSKAIPESVARVENVSA